jgi:hypothetical protein
MDIERKNFLKELETEFDNNVQNNTSESNSDLVTLERIDEIFNEATNKFGTTLKKLKD